MMVPDTRNDHPDLSWPAGIRYCKNPWHGRNCFISNIWGLIGLLISIIVVLSSCGISHDLSDISKGISSYSVVFKSERGFGNDRFDVYSFSLKKPGNISGFRVIDKESKKLFEDYTDMIDIELMDDPVKASSLIADINIVGNMEDGQYMHVNRKGVEKLYLYSPTLNRGYCLILVI